MDHLLLIALTNYTNLVDDRCLILNSWQPLGLTLRNFSKYDIWLFFSLNLALQGKLENQPIKIQLEGKHGMRSKCKNCMIRR